MNVRIKFDYPEELLGEYVLASFRRGNAGEGWSIRLRGRQVEVAGVEGYYWICATLGLRAEDNDLEWRVIGDRHELWFFGRQVAECMSALSMPPDGQLHVGTDPHHSTNEWPYRISVEV